MHLSVHRGAAWSVSPLSLWAAAHNLFFVLLATASQRGRARGPAEERHQPFPPRPPRSFPPPRAQDPLLLPQHQQTAADLLDHFSRHIRSICMEIRSINENIDQTREMWEMGLDAARNRIITFNMQARPPREYWGDGSPRDAVSALAAFFPAVCLCMAFVAQSISSLARTPHLLMPRLLASQVSMASLAVGVCSLPGTMFGMNLTSGWESESPSAFWNLIFYSSLSR